VLIYSQQRGTKTISLHWQFPVVTTRLVVKDTGRWVGGGIRCRIIQAKLFIETEGSFRTISFSIGPYPAACLLGRIDPRRRTGPAETWDIDAGPYEPNPWRRILEPHLFRTEEEWVSWKKEQQDDGVNVFDSPTQFPCFAVARYEPNSCGKDDYLLFFVYQNASGEWDINRALTEPQ
jgi:hypothetical protein